MLIDRDPFLLPDRGAPQSRPAHLRAVTSSDIEQVHELPALPLSSRPLLSDREVEVLLTWLRCESKEVAAQELFISPSTVSTHITRIRHKYAAAGRPANRKAVLLARALQDGYTSLDDW